MPCASQVEGRQGTYAFVVECAQRPVVSRIEPGGLLPHGALGGAPAQFSASEPDPDSTGSVCVLAG